MKTIELNGVTFKVVKPKTSNWQHWQDLFYLDIPIRNLRECYVNPSTTKIAIYEDWRNWFDTLLRDTRVSFKQFNGVASFNCMQFTLHGLVCIDDIDYIVYITKTRHELIEVIR